MYTNIIHVQILIEYTILGIFRIKYVIYRGNNPIQMCIKLTYPTLYLYVIKYFYRPV